MSGSASFLVAMETGIYTGVVGVNGSASFLVAIETGIYTGVVGVASPRRGNMIGPGLVVL